jgi:ABC-type uncharacterized transport system involved in gliding motility auxiliary subunit
LSQPVTAKAFYTSRTAKDSAKSLLDSFQLAGKGKFNYTFIDPESDPVAAQAANITQDGTIVLTMGERSQPARSVSEGELINAIARLENPQAAVIYFLTGHGEYSPDDTGDKGYSQVKSTLENRNYVVKTLNLLAENAIPEDAKLLVIAGPRDPIAPAEIAIIQKYQETGGSLIVMEEPTLLTNIDQAADPLVDYLQQNWGVTVGNDIVVDLTSQQPYAPYAASYGNSPITEAIQRSATQFPTARTVRAGSAAPGISQVELVLTAQQSWAETDVDALKNEQAQPNFDQAADQPGPVSLAVAAENFTTKARLVAFGDADFVIDANYGAYANSSLFSYAVDWAVGQENLINISPKTSTQRMVVPPQAAVMNLIFLGTVILLPALALIGGIVVFIQRRRQG